MNVLMIISGALAGYLLGSINAAVLVSKIGYNKDIRDFGSGNAGTTNMLRTFGKRAALITLLIDLFKGVIACLIPYLVFFVAMSEKYYGVLSVLAAAMGAVFGHNWPVYFGFKGGKGVLVSFSVMLFIAPLPALIALGVFIIVVAISKYVSLGSILAAVCFPIAEYFIGGWLPYTKGLSTTLVVSIIICALMIVRHHANIGRLIKGKESKLSFKSRDKG